jgi:hypothetical protein
VGAVAGGAVVVHGADVTASGAMQLWTGRESSTFTSQGISKGLQAAGVSKPKADVTADYADATLSIILSGGVGAARNAAMAPKIPYINLASEERTVHILAGDATGGGHAWFGSLKSFANGLLGKSMFPMSWSNEEIMHAVSEVAVNNPWIQQTGKAGAALTKSGQPVRFVVEGMYGATKIRVITTRTDIITAFPIK